MAAFQAGIGAPNISLGLPAQPNYADLMFKGFSSIGDALQSNRDYARELAADKLKTEAFGYEKEHNKTLDEIRRGQLEVQRQQNVIEAGKSGLMIDPSGKVVQDPSLPVGGSLTAAQMLAAKNAETDNLANLRKSQRDLPSYKKVAESAPVYRSMAAAANKDDQIASLQMIYGMAKIFDPDSVVMNGERATIENSQSVPDYLKGELERILGQGGTLSAETKQRMIREARSRLVEYRKQYDIESAGTAEFAKARGMDPAQAIVSFGPDDQLFGPDPYRMTEPDPNVPIVPIGP
jgi:hypothetical protein